MDGDDLEVFEDCTSGPSMPHDDTPACRTVDFDQDGDVDTADFAAFQRSYEAK